MHPETVTCTGVFSQSQPGRQGLGERRSAALARCVHLSVHRCHCVHDSRIAALRHVEDSGITTPVPIGIVDDFQAERYTCGVKSCGRRLYQLRRFFGRDVPVERGPRDRSGAALVPRRRGSRRSRADSLRFSLGSRSETGAHADTPGRRPAQLGRVSSHSRRPLRSTTIFSLSTRLHPPSWVARAGTRYSRLRVPR